MSFTSFSRRKLLASIAAAGGVSRLGPFLPASVRAAEAPKRILTIFHPMGYLEKEFFPTGAGADFTLGASLKVLDPWKQKLTFIDGLTMYGAQYYWNFPSNEHGLGENMAFTGGKYIRDGYGVDSPSIDQVIADFQYNQVKTQLRSLNLSVNADGGPFYSKAGTPVKSQRNPQAAFDQLFNGFTGPTAPPATGGAPSAPSTGSGSVIDTSARDRKLKQDQSILNMVKGDLARVRALAGKEDQVKLDTHLGGISSLENRLKLMAGGPSPSTPKPVGMTPSSPPVAAGSITAGCAKPTLSAAGSIESAVHSQMDLITAAFACDMTRSASLQLGGANGGMDDAVPGLNQHGITHSSGPGVSQATLDDHKKFDRWYAARWAYLLNRLDSIKEGNGTLLDNTLILFASDTYTSQGAAGEFGAHALERIPMWMAGGGAFAFKTGQVVNAPGLKRSGGGRNDLHLQWTPHHRLLTSVCQAFGMNVDSFGGNDPGKGAIAQLTRA